ncbi:uncharacterized protein LOC117316943 [Pecten maximus]|uniref:uncharacterized protein LOC117316943 n=1 Tax=Pecten maximus TaxID=6579 RepID=UPI0014585BD6|nr:uncharacterized protein LOC117316943 [Pecten maximus]
MSITRGIGTKKKRSDPIDQDDENKLWETGQFGPNSSHSLLNTVFFYNCKLFGLRAMDEHRGLQCDQFVCGSDNTGTFIQFDGRTSKNIQGGLKHRKLEAKSIKHYSVSGEERSLYDIYKVYLEKINTDPTGPFYRRPLDGPGQRFSSQPVGVNKLSVLIKSCCSAAGLSGQFRNHSGKRTCATPLFQQGVDKQLIMSRTGHRSKSIQKALSSTSGTGQ